MNIVRPQLVITREEQMVLRNLARAMVDLNINEYEFLDEVAVHEGEFEYNGIKVVIAEP